MPQQELICRVRERCQSDSRVSAALMYGSFAHGQADRCSDIEFWLFIADDALDDIAPHAWIADVAPVYATVVVESGAHVALFRPDVVRGEFHFAPASGLAQVGRWTALGVSPENLEQMLVVDRTGELRRILAALVDVSGVPSSAEDIGALCGRFVDAYVFGLGVLARGELVRAHVLLGMLHGYLAWMARLHYGAVERWATPTKAFESDLPAEAQERYRRCTASAERDALSCAYQQAWQWGGELLAELGQTHGFALSDDLLAVVSERTRALAAPAH